MHLTDMSARVYELPAEPLAAASLIVPNLITSKSLPDVEETIRALRTTTEIDYERDKANSRARERRYVSPTQFQLAETAVAASPHRNRIL
ncbi:hypothetical protein EV191_101632 [Tamaricihabitans halophyticus]|uniref:Uncharacterized protein n=1 Tax=Tamaricihabitans halophyticus TaxID=1262583 RepID=A0A4V2SV11_9PSEU|nr:hypothetical protein EV191_101632 [Tamaricihabitans halophyticus]